MKNKLWALGSKLCAENTIKDHRRSARLVFGVTLMLVTITLFSIPSSATIGNIVKSDLTGTWQIALTGTTGCGKVAMQATATLNSAGKGTATLTTHGDCGDSTLSGQTFNINTLATNGSGTAGLSCGTACGWNFNIQVSPDRTRFNLVDVSTVNPGNYVQGVAILSSPAGDIVTPDLTGDWQATLYGNTGCGISAMLVTFTLNSSGQASNATITGHAAGCADATTGGLSFDIASLNPDGSGTAGLSCGTACGWEFNIQVSPDRSSFNLVDVATVNPFNYLAGVAIRQSTAGFISKTNLAGPWQLAIDSQTGCGTSAMLVSFTLNATGVANNITTTSHTSGCGDGTVTGNTFTIQTLNADGSGTANLTCGPACGWNLNIQVSPDRSTFNVVDVSSANPGNFMIGKAIHK